MTITNIFDSFVDNVHNAYVDSSSSGHAPGDGVHGDVERPAQDLPLPQLGHVLLLQPEVLLRGRALDPGPIRGELPVM